jgi:hypothetical protein
MIIQIGAFRVLEELGECGWYVLVFTREIKRKVIFGKAQGNVVYIIKCMILI